MNQKSDNQKEEGIPKKGKHNTLPIVLIGILISLTFFMIIIGNQEYDIITEESRFYFGVNQPARETPEWIDELVIWNFSITTDEVSDLYNDGFGIDSSIGGLNIPTEDSINEVVIYVR